MRKTGSLPLVIVSAVALALFVLTLALGDKPGLGLDLRGGISVVLEPVVNGQPAKKVPADSLEQTKQIIENRVNAIGATEPDITVQGKDILVQLPGVKDQKRALSLVGQTAQLRFRPVLETLGTQPGKATTDQIAKLRKKLKIPKGVTGLDLLNQERTARGQDVIADPNAPATTTTVPGATTTTVPGATTTAPAAAVTTTVPATSTTTPGSGTGGSKAAKVARLRADNATTTTAAKATTTTAAGATTTTVPAATTTTTIDPAPKNKYGIKVYKNKTGALNTDLNTLITLEQQVEANTTNKTTPESGDKPGATVILLGQDTGQGATRYKLGPQALSGSAIKDATAGLGTDGKWTVNPEFKDGADGIDKFNAIAAKCNAGDAVCPAQTGSQYGQLAIVLDGVVISAPTIEVSSFQADQVQISGSFTNQTANDLATALRYGSLPLTLKPQTVQTVSATLGSGALRAGLIAGAVGLGLVALFLVLYYRILGLITLGALTVSAMLLWTIISFLGTHVGLTLTLSGIVGIIVSIGVSLDSSVVYYENLKEDVRNGKSLRTSVDRSYKTAFSTIVKADFSSLIGAIVLYLLSIGPVKGFALFLGLSTLLDLFTSYFITRPAVALLGHSKLGLRPELFGIPTDDLNKPAEPSAEQKVPVTTGGSSGDSGGEH